MRVGIFGFTTTNYVLSLTSNIASTLLQLGVTQRYSVQENTASLFRVLLSEQYTRSPYTFRISVTPESGHVSMIVTCGPEPVLSMNESMWTLRSIQAGDILDIPSISVTDNGCLRSSGSFYVSVLGDSAATFSILASMVRNSTVLPLSPTIPSRGNLKYHNIDYFYVRPGDVYNDARLMVTVLQGDVDLYIGKDWESRPKLSNGDIVSYVAKSSTVGDEDLTLNHDKLQDWCKDRNDCYIIVAVVGSFGAASSSASSTYSLLMTWKDSMITLENGIPRKGVVSSGRMEYYKFTLTQVGFDVRIALAALTGDPGNCYSFYSFITGY